MRIASWNVNSLRVRLEQVIDWLERDPVDVLALQETKLTDEKFPVEAVEAAGYRCSFVGQKTYNGVAVLTRDPPADVVMALPGSDDPQQRFIAVTVGGVRVVNVYVPNGEAVDSDKYAYKLNWLSTLNAFLTDEMKQYPELVLLGDFNIAPADDDVYKPERWKDKVLCSEPERTALNDLLALGLVDTFREFEQEPATYSWWDYRFNGFKRNAGLRIDLVLASEALNARCTSSTVDPAPRALERPSDHAPAVAEFD